MTAYPINTMRQKEPTLVADLTEKHIDQLIELFAKEFWCNQRARPGVERMLSHSDIVVGAIDSANDLVGFVRVLTDYEYKATIFDLIVRSDWRGQKLGRVLMNAVIFHPALKCVEHIDLNCLPEMYAFYEKWGFTSELAGLGFMRYFNRGK